MITDDEVHIHKRAVVHSIILRAHTLADDISVHRLHEVFEQRHTGVGEKVATVFGRVRDDAIHLVEFLAGNGVSN